MNKNLRGFGKKVARDTRNEVIDNRVTSPLARKAGGCATVLAIIIFAGLGRSLSYLITRSGGDVDKYAPIIIGVGLVVGIIVGATIGSLVGKVLRKLTIK